MDRIKKLVLSVCHVDEEKFVREAHIIEDLGFDSLRVVELIMAVEDETEENIPDEILNSISTLGDLLDYLDGKLSISGNSKKSSILPSGINLEGM